MIRRALRLPLLPLRLTLAAYHWLEDDIPDENDWSLL